jgi:P4 family phage/plasmid primase-like protien
MADNNIDLLEGIAKILADQAKDDKKRDKKKPAPTDDELRDRYIANEPMTAYGLGEWRRYQNGIYLPIPEEIIADEIAGVLEMAKTEGIRPCRSLTSSVMELTRWKITKPKELWDTNIDIVVCQNGVLNIPTMTLRPYSPLDYATFKVGYDYDPTATAPVWNYALDSTIPEAKEFLQEFFGYCLTHDVQYEIALWLQGYMGSGKSTTITAAETLLGDRATKLGLADIERSRFALGNLIGKTLAVATEQPAIYMQASHLLNSLISGEKITIERKFKDPVDFYPKVKVMWAMNELPRIPDAGNGLFRRVKVIKFPPIDEARRDPEIKEAIKKEGAGILNWAIEGLRRLRARGKFLIPACIQTATASFMQNNDIPALFVQDKCLTAADFSGKPNPPELKTQSRALYTAYKDWCLETGHKPMSETSLAGEWERIGFTKKKTPAGMFWYGVGVKIE